MNEKRREEPEARLTRLRCRRLERQLELTEHQRCPYCFGPLREIERGRYECFCDFRSGVDPIHFGFPPDSQRQQSG